MREYLQRLGILFLFEPQALLLPLALSEAIFVKQAGQVQHAGLPVAITAAPEHHFVADFIGAANIIQGHKLMHFLVEFNGCQLACADAGMRPKAPVVLVYWPVHLAITAADAGMQHVVLELQLFRGDY